MLTKKILTGLEPFSNKIFAVETVQIAHIINIVSMGACKLLSIIRKATYRRLFSFSDNTMLSQFAQKAARMPPIKANRRQSSEEPIS